MTKAHAKLSASGSAKWIYCPGSLEAESKYPNKSNSKAEEGTLAHELGDICLKTKVDAKEYLGKEITVNKDGKVLSVIVDSEMANNVQHYLDYVRSFETDKTIMFNEDRVNFSHIAKEGFGTLDCAIFDPETGVCHIIDLKYGRNEISAIDNTQGQLYALGLYEELKFLEGVKSFCIHIVQPRINNYSEWEVTIEDLLAFGEFAKTRAEMALTKGAKKTAGAKQCQWCLHRDNCEVLDAFNTQMTAEAFEDLDDLDGIPLTRVAEILQNIKLIKSFLESIEKRAYREMMEGKTIPGYKIVMANTKRVWKPEAEEILVKALGEDAYNKKLKGLGDIEKLLGKKEVAQLAEKPEGQPTIAPEKDKRPAIDINSIGTIVADDFEDLE